MITVGFFQDGYSFKTNYIQNCISSHDAIMKVIDKAIVTLNKRCEIVSKICLDVKEYSKAVVTINIIRNSLVLFKGKFDLDDKNEKSDILSIIKGILGIPKKIKSGSVTKGIYCENGTNIMNIDSKKRMLGMFQGQGLIHIEFDHDTGKSCFDFDGYLYRQ